jgi:hypothetical protein
MQTTGAGPYLAPACHAHACRALVVALQRSCYSLVRHCAASLIKTRAHMAGGSGGAAHDAWMVGGSSSNNMHPGGLAAGVVVGGGGGATSDIPLPHRWGAWGNLVVLCAAVLQVSEGRGGGR